MRHPEVGRVRAAEVMAALSLATDLGIGVPIEHGLQACCWRCGWPTTWVSTRPRRRRPTTPACCSMSAAPPTRRSPPGFRRRRRPGATWAAGQVRVAVELLAGLMRALASRPGQSGAAAGRADGAGPAEGGPGVQGPCHRVLRGGPDAGGRLGLPTSMQGLFAFLVERWDGRGLPGRGQGEEIPLPVRIASVARDAAFQRELGGVELAAGWSASGPGARSTPTWPSRRRGRRTRPGGRCPGLGGDAGPRAWPRR